MHYTTRHIFLKIKESLSRLFPSNRKSSPYSLPKEARTLLHRIRERKLTYLSEKKLVSLAETVLSLRDRQIQGIHIETGCALGGSSILIASLKEEDRPFFIYDVFEMIPPPTDNDPKEVHERYKMIVEGMSKGIKGDTYYGYVKDLHSVVRTNLREFGIQLEEKRVQLIKGLVQDTLHGDEPVALAHVDVDWYEPVKTCLARLYPRLVRGGCMILDDYHSWGGCRKATDEFLEVFGKSCSFNASAGSMKITKLTD